MTISRKPWRRRRAMLVASVLVGILSLAAPPASGHFDAHTDPQETVYGDIASVRVRDLERDGVKIIRAHARMYEESYPVQLFTSHTLWSFDSRDGLEADYHVSISEDPASGGIYSVSLLDADLEIVRDRIFSVLREGGFAIPRRWLRPTRHIRWMVSYSEDGYDGTLKDFYEFVDAAPDTGWYGH